MSFILDALRRAEAERERGAVPGLHTQQFGALPAEEERAPRRGGLIVAVAVLASALVGVLAWTWLGRDASPSARDGVVVATAPAAVAPSSPAPSPSPSLSPSPSPLPSPSLSPSPLPSPSLSPSPSPMPVPATTPMPMPAAVPAARPTPTLSTPSARADTSTPSTPPRRSVVAARDEAKRAGTAAAAATQRRAEPGEAMPDEFLRQMPKIAIAGASYSSDAASRMVMVNGHVFHEGDTITPGLVLTQIKLKSAVVTYKGFRHELTY